MKGCQFLIAYRCGSNIEYSIVGFKAANFKHFTGLHSSLPPDVFYHRLINHMLSPEDFSFDSLGNAQQKLAVLPQLHNLFYSHTLRGVFNRSGIFLQADYAVGNTAGSYSVAFCNGKGYDYPVSLYNEDVRKLTVDTTKVLAVWKRHFGEKTFSENTYHASDVDPDELLRVFQEK